MAFKAKITAVNALPDGSEIAVDVDYYDDAAPTVILYHKAFEFAITMTLAQMRNAIIAFGTKVRDAVTEKTSAAQQFVGTVLDIP